MNKPKFEFGQLVVPTAKAFRNGVFPWAKEDTIEGLVIWAEKNTIRVCVRGHKKPKDYHPSFWQGGEVEVFHG